jgi:hypothetical protein
VGLGLATPEQKASAHKKIQALSAHVREAASEIGLYLIWSSS